MAGGESLKIMVFGGSGFIGSHLVDVLLREGHNVTIFDIMQPKARDISFIKGDILDSVSVTQSLSDFEVVFNFAGLSDLNYARNNPLGTSKLNIEGCINILNGAVQNNVKKFVLASTLYTLGNKGNFYRCSKLAAEMYVREFTKIYGLRHTILHFGSVYGNRSNQENGVYSILYNALFNNTFIHNNDLDSEREYIHVVDAVQICSEIISEKYDNKNLLISGSTKVRKIDFYKLLNEMLGKELKLVESENMLNDHYMYTPFSFQPNGDLKYVPNQTIDFQQGLFNLLSEIRKEH